MSAQPIVIAVTCVTGTMVPYALKALRKSNYFNYKIIGLSHEQVSLKTKSYIDKHFLVPLGNNDLYNSKILEIVKEENVNIILPWSDEEALALSKIYKAKTVREPPPTITKLIVEKISSHGKIRTIIPAKRA